MSLGMLANVYTMVRKRCVQTTERADSYTHRRSHTHPHTRSLSHTWGQRDGSGVQGARASHLGFPFLQEGLEPLLSGTALVVVAHNQDDVVPVELAHQVEPNVRLVGVGGDGPQEGQVDTLQKQDVKTRTSHQLLMNDCFSDSLNVRLQLTDFWCQSNSRWPP